MANQPNWVIQCLKCDAGNHPGVVGREGYGALEETESRV